MSETRQLSMGELGADQEEAPPGEVRGTHLVRCERCSSRLAADVKRCGGSLRCSAAAILRPRARRKPRTLPESRKC